MNSQPGETPNTDSDLDRAIQLSLREQELEEQKRRTLKVRFCMYIFKPIYTHAHSQTNE